MKSSHASILADHCGNDCKALNFYQRFKWAVVAAPSLKSVAS